jgi:hypothetical protein
VAKNGTVRDNFGVLWDKFGIVSAQFGVIGDNLRSTKTSKIAIFRSKTKKNKSSVSFSLYERRDLVDNNAHAESALR